MTDSSNRRTAGRTTTRHAASNLAAPQHRRGTYTDRYDRPHTAPWTEGTYVSGAKHRSRPGSYTDVDGALNRAIRPEGYYTMRDVGARAATHSGRRL